MNSTPQVQTQEIADADLDAVAGGVVTEVLATATGVADSVAPVTQTLTNVNGLAAGATGVDALATTSQLTAGL